uniref:Syndecan n=1 Tax=Xiphophorus couchianus TaxID=32473 RepID=A0A3B5N0X2_9TELE
MKLSLSQVKLELFLLLFTSKLINSYVNYVLQPQHVSVIVGGVVGALFAAFLVMLLVYRMKKKDEGSYTLEEPKQATVTYQKPDKQEEFYA